MSSGKANNSLARLFTFTSSERIQRRWKCLVIRLGGELELRAVTHVVTSDPHGIGSICPEIDFATSGARNVGYWHKADIGA